MSFNVNLLITHVLRTRVFVRYHFEYFQLILYENVFPMYPFEYEQFNIFEAFI